MTVDIRLGDSRRLLEEIPDGAVNMCVSSPPYFGLRDYEMDDQMGMEASPDEYVAGMVELFREVRRCLRDDGTLWLNIGDSYATDSKWGGSTSGKAAAALHGTGGGGRNKTRVGLPDKNLIGIPWRVAFALQADGWFLRQDIIWSKPNPMPESVTDRCTKAHEYIFLFSKQSRYYYDHLAIQDGLAPASVARLAQDVDQQTGSERVPGKTNGTMKAVGGHRKRGSTAYHSGYETNHLSLDSTGRGEGRNKRSVWTVATQPYKGAHFATFPPKLIEPCIKAGCPIGGTVLDPFGGAGTTGLVADRLQRNAILLELNPQYVEMARQRIDADRGGGLLDGMEAA